MLRLLTQYLVFLLLSISQILFSSLVQAIQQPLKVGFIMSPNYFIHDELNTYGFDYDILTAFAQTKNTTLKLKVYRNIKDLQIALESNEVDIIAGNLTDNIQILDRKYQTAPYNKERLLIVGYSLHHQSTVNYPTNQSVWHNNYFSYPQLNINLKPTSLDSYNLYSYMNHDRLYQKQSIDYLIISANKARALNQLYPKLKVFDVLDQNGKVAQVNDVFYIKDQNLKTEFNHFLTSFLVSKRFANIKYANFNAITKPLMRVEIQTFVNNMQSKYKQYKGLFQEYSTAMDWRLAMAVGYQESRWTPNAVSPWGPSGFMMLTNASAKQLGVTNKLDATQSIREGVKLLMRFKNNLVAEIKGHNRDMYAISNYNQGIAKIIDARTWLRKHNLSPNSWVELAKNLPAMSNDKHKYGKINGKLASEYILGVRRWYYMIVNYIYFYRT